MTRTPTVAEAAAGWWDATRTRRLVLQHCSACDWSQHPPRRLCSNCGAVDALEWVPASGQCVLDAYTVIHRAPADGVDVPYVLARVRLREGPVLLTHLVDVPHDDTVFDRPLHLTWRPLPDGRHLPLWSGVPTPAPDERHKDGF